MSERIRTPGVFNGAPRLPQTTGAGDTYPVTLSVGAFIEWYWRIKNYSLVSDAFAADGVGGVNTFNNAPLVDFNSTNERNLILNPVPFSFGIGSVAPLGGTFVLFGEFTDPSTFKYLQPTGSTYQPALAIVGTLDINDGGTNDATITITSDRSLFTGVTYTSFNGSIAGVTVPLYYFGEAHGSGSFGISSFVLTPCEYRPYAANDATPIYDTSTGTQLQDPRN